MSDTAVHIGELARRTGVSARSLRYYEQRGLLRSQRSEAGWRIYDQRVVTRVRNVRRLLGVGLTVDDILELEHCLDADDLVQCDRPDDAVELHRTRLEAIEERIAALEQQRTGLQCRIDQLRALHDAANGGAQ